MNAGNGLWADVSDADAERIKQANQAVADSHANRGATSPYLIDPAEEARSDIIDEALAVPPGALPAETQAVPPGVGPLPGPATAETLDGTNTVDYRRRLTPEALARHDDVVRGGREPPLIGLDPKQEFDPSDPDAGAVAPGDEVLRDDQLRYIETGRRGWAPLASLADPRVGPLLRGEQAALDALPADLRETLGVGSGFVPRVLWVLDQMDNPHSERLVPPQPLRECDADGKRGVCASDVEGYEHPLGPEPTPEQAAANPEPVDLENVRKIQQGRQNELTPTDAQAARDWLRAALGSDNPSPEVLALVPKELANRWGLREHPRKLTPEEIELVINGSEEDRSTGLSPYDETVACSSDGLPMYPANGAEAQAFAQAREQYGPSGCGSGSPGTPRPELTLGMFRERCTGDPFTPCDDRVSEDTRSRAIYDFGPDGSSSPLAALDGINPNAGRPAGEGTGDSNQVVNPHIGPVVDALPPRNRIRPIEPGTTYVDLVCESLGPTCEGLSEEELKEEAERWINADEVRYQGHEGPIYIDTPIPEPERGVPVPLTEEEVESFQQGMLQLAAHRNADWLRGRSNFINEPEPEHGVEERYDWSIRHEGQQRADEQLDNIAREEEEVDSDCGFLSITPCGGLMMDPEFVAAVGDGDVGGAFAATGNHIADWYQNGPRPTSNAVYNGVADLFHVIVQIPEGAVTLAVDTGQEFVVEPATEPFTDDALLRQPDESALEHYDRTGRSPVTGRFAEGYRDVVDEEAGETVGSAFHDRPISTGLTYLGPLGLLLPTRAPVGRIPRARGAYPRPIFETGLPRSAPRSTFPDINGGGRWAPETCMVCEVSLSESPRKPGASRLTERLPRPGPRPPTSRPRSPPDGPGTTRPPGSSSPAQQPRPSPAVERRPTSAAPESGVRPTPAAEGRGPSRSSDPSGATPRSGNVPVRQPRAPRHAPKPEAPAPSAGGSAPNRPASGRTQGRPPRSSRPRGRPDRWWNAPVTPRPTSRPGGVRRRPGESRRKARTRYLNETVQAVDKNGRPKVNKRGRPIYAKRRNLTRKERRALARIEDGLCSACREAFADRRLKFVESLPDSAPGSGDAAPRERTAVEVTIPETRGGRSSRPQHEPVEHPRGGMDKQKEHTLEYSKRETPLAQDVRAASERLRTARQEAAAAAEAAKRARALARKADPETVPVARQRARDLSMSASIARKKVKQAKKELMQARARQDALFWREGVFGRWMYTRVGRVLANMASKAALVGVIGAHVFGVSHVVRFVDHVVPLSDSVAVVRTIDTAPPKGSVIEGVVDGSTSKRSPTTHAVELPEPLQSKPRISEASPTPSGSFFTRLFNLADHPNPAMPRPAQRGGPGLLISAVSGLGVRVVGAYYAMQDARSDSKARRKLRGDETPVEVTVGTGSNAWSDLVERLEQIAYDSEPGAYVLVRVPKGADILASHIAELGAALGLRAQVGYNASQLSRHSFQVVLRRAPRESLEIDVGRDSPAEREVLDHAFTFSARALQPGGELEVHNAFPWELSDAELLLIAEEHGFREVDFRLGEGTDVIVLRRLPRSAPAPALEATASRARLPSWVDSVQASLERGDLGGVLVSLRGLIDDARAAAAESPRRAPTSPRRRPELRIAALAERALERLLAGAPGARTLGDVEDAGVTLPSKGSDAERELNLLLARMLKLLGMAAVLTAAGTAAGAAAGPRVRGPTTRDPSRAVSDTAPAAESLPIDDDLQTRSARGPPANQGQGADPRTGTVDDRSGNSSDASKPAVTQDVTGASTEPRRVTPARSRRTPRIIGLVLALVLAAPLTSDAPAPTQARQSVEMSHDARDLPHGLPSVGSQTSSRPARRGRRAGGDGPQRDDPGPTERPGVKDRLIGEVERALELTLTDASRARLHDVPAPELRDFNAWVRSEQRGPWLRGVLERNISQRTHADGAEQLQMLFAGRGLNVGPALSNALADALPRTSHEAPAPPAEEAPQPAPQRMRDAIRNALRQLVPPGARLPLAELEQELGMLGLRPGANATMTEPELIEEINSAAHPGHQVVLAEGGKYVVIGLRRPGPRSEHGSEESYDPEQWRLSNEDLRKAREREQARRQQDQAEVPAPKADPKKGRDSGQNEPGWYYSDPGSTFGAIAGPVVLLAVAAMMGAPVLAWMPDWLPLAAGGAAMVIGAARDWGRQIVSRLRGWLARPRAAIREWRRTALGRFGRAAVVVTLVLALTGGVTTATAEPPPSADTSISQQHTDHQVPALPVGRSSLRPGTHRRRPADRRRGGSPITNDGSLGTDILLAVRNWHRVANELPIGPVARVLLHWLIAHVAPRWVSAPYPAHVQVPSGSLETIARVGIELGVDRQRMTEKESVAWARALAAGMPSSMVQRLSGLASLRELSHELGHLIQLAIALARGRSELALSEDALAFGITRRVPFPVRDQRHVLDIEDERFAEGFGWWMWERAVGERFGLSALEARAWREHLQRAERAARPQGWVDWPTAEDPNRPGYERPYPPEQVERLLSFSAWRDEQLVSGREEQSQEAITRRQSGHTGRAHGFAFAGVWVFAAGLFVTVATGVGVVGLALTALVSLAVAAREGRWVARNLRAGTATRAGDRTRAPPWVRNLGVLRGWLGGRRFGRGLVAVALVTALSGGLVADSSAPPAPADTSISQQHTDHNQPALPTQRRTNHRRDRKPTSPTDVELLALADDALARAWQLEGETRILLDAMDRNPAPAAVQQMADALREVVRAHTAAVMAHRRVVEQAANAEVRRVAEERQALSEGALAELHALVVPGTESFRKQPDGLIGELATILIRDEEWLRLLYSLRHDPRYESGEERRDLQRLMLDVAGGAVAHQRALKLVVDRFRQHEADEIAPLRDEAQKTDDPALKARVAALMLGRLLAEQMAIEGVMPGDPTFFEVAEIQDALVGQIRELVMQIWRMGSVYEALPQEIREVLLVDDHKQPSTREQVALLTLDLGESLGAHRDQLPRIYQSDQDSAEIVVSGWSANLGSVQRRPRGRYNPEQNLVGGFANSPVAELLYALGLWVGDVSGGSSELRLRDFYERMYPWLHADPTSFPRRGEQGARALYADAYRLFVLNREAAELLWGAEFVESAAVNFEPRKEVEPAQPQTSHEVTVTAEPSSATDPEAELLRHAMDLGEWLMSLAREREAAATRLYQLVRGREPGDPLLRWALGELSDSSDLYRAIRVGYSLLLRHSNLRELVRGMAHAGQGVARIESLIGSDAAHGRVGLGELVPDWSGSSSTSVLRSVHQLFKDADRAADRSRQPDDGPACRLGCLVGEIRAIHMWIVRGTNRSHDPAIGERLARLGSQALREAESMAEARMGMEGRHFFDRLNALLEGGLIIDHTGSHATHRQVAELYRYPEDGLRLFGHLGVGFYFSHQTARGVNDEGWRGQLANAGLPAPPRGVRYVYLRERQLVVIFGNAAPGDVLEAASQIDPLAKTWPSDLFKGLFARVTDSPQSEPRDNWLGGSWLLDRVDSLRFLNEDAATRLWGHQLVRAAEARFEARYPTERGAPRGARELGMGPFGLLMLGLVITFAGGGLVAFLATMTAFAAAMRYALRQARNERAGSAKRAGFGARDPPVRRGASRPRPLPRGARATRPRHLTTGPAGSPARGRFPAIRSRRPPTTLWRTWADVVEPGAQFAARFVPMDVVRSRLQVGEAWVELYLVPGIDNTAMGWLIEALIEAALAGPDDARTSEPLRELAPGVEPWWPGAYDYVATFDEWQGHDRLLSIGEAVDTAHGSHVLDMTPRLRFEDVRVFQAVVADESAPVFEDLAEMQALFIFGRHTESVRRVIGVFPQPLTELQLAQIAEAAARTYSPLPGVRVDRLRGELLKFIHRDLHGQGNLVASLFDEMARHMLRHYHSLSHAEFLERLGELRPIPQRILVLVPPERRQMFGLFVDDGPDAPPFSALSTVVTVAATGAVVTAWLKFGHGPEELAAAVVFVTQRTIERASAALGWLRRGWRWIRDRLAWRAVGERFADRDSGGDRTPPLTQLGAVDPGRPPAPDPAPPTVVVDRPDARVWPGLWGLPSIRGPPEGGP